MKSLFTFFVLVLVASVANAQSDFGILPVGADGRPLNLDFETGTLKDWIAAGDAFKDQPIQGDTVFPRRSDAKSRHQGQFWIGGYERHGDKATGTLSSIPFKVTHPWATFLVAGGPWEETRVELVRADTKKVFFKTTGLEAEDLMRVAVDLKDHQGQEIFVRVVDEHKGHWGHVNFDDFRFHMTKPTVPVRAKMPAGLDQFKFAGLPPEKAAQVMTVPEGFDVTLFAGEPDVHQPVALAIDDRGRVWVAEAHCYPQRRKGLEPIMPLLKDSKFRGDRILIFEDTNGDGKFDKKTVFMEGLNLVSGLELGFGGVWIGAAPYLMFVPMKDDRPSGPPQILLDGWGWQDTHETLNAFIWGPDGWLYGNHGVFTYSKVGKPGTPDKDRTPINAGVWRYHPTRHVFEVFAHGTSNPWGLDFNDHGEAFVEACVIPHNFHIIQGGRYHRQAGSHFDPHTYDDIKTIADHFHYLGATPHGGNNKSDEAGGGHAHCGTMIYLGGTWPKEYRNQMFMGNIHGRRLNVDIPTPKGSGYVAKHGKDFLLGNDAYNRFINMRYGPDGNVYLIDWYDKQACHHNDPKIWDRETGRIFKISHRSAKWTPVDLTKKTNAELVALQLHENDWYVRHARRLLQERAHQENLKLKAKYDQIPKAVNFLNILEESKKIGVRLMSIANEHPNPARRLRALWAMHVVGWGDATRFLTDSSEHVRGWQIRLALENGHLDEIRYGAESALQKAAHEDASPVVRRHLASALQRLPLEKRWAIAEGLVSHAEDIADHNLPLLIWYGISPLADADPARALDLAAKSKFPNHLPFMIRRIAFSGSDESLGLLVAALSKVDTSATQAAFLSGLREALKGRRQVTMPKEWPNVSAKLLASESAEVRNHALGLAATFGDPQAFTKLRDALTATDVPVQTRQNALATLLAARDAELVPVLQKLVRDPALRGSAIKGLATYDAPATPATLMADYATFSAEEKRDALITLASRPIYGKALVAALETKKVPVGDVSADIVRQLRNLGDPVLGKKIANIWGVIRDTPADRAKAIADTRKKLQSIAKVTPDISLGRAIFTKTCQQCHTLFGEGGKVGPDITGANRASLDYLLENILDPSAVIQKEYAATVIELNNGRVVTGIVRGETGAAITLVTANETLTIPRDEIDERKDTTISMMPDDLLKTLNDHEIRSLILYVQSPQQVSLPPGFEKSQKK